MPVLITMIVFCPSYSYGFSVFAPVYDPVRDRHAILGGYELRTWVRKFSIKYNL